MTQVPLFTTPLLWLTVTLAVFALFEGVSKRSNRHPLCHPVLWSTPAIAGMLFLTGTQYATYHAATFSLSFLLGPAVVGLAVPIWEQRRRLCRLAMPLALALLAGAMTSIVTGVGVLVLFHAPQVLQATIAPRATTTPVAMALATELGGIAPLAAVLVLASGVFGTMIGLPVLKILKIHDRRIQGLAIGISAHGIGAARAFQIDPQAGAFASLGLALNAMATAGLLSILALIY